MFVRSFSTTSRPALRTAVRSQVAPTALTPIYKPADPTSKPYAHHDSGHRGRHLLPKTLTKGASPDPRPSSANASDIRQSPEP